MKSVIMCITLQGNRQNNLADAPSYTAESTPQAEAEELAQQGDALERERQQRINTKREQLAAESRKVEAQRQQPAMGERPSVSTSGETGRDGRFIAYNNGTVLDSKTNVMWASKDNGRDINWADAKSYCESYRGGGYTDWRMPTQDELAELHDAGKSRPAACSTSSTIHVATELIDITCFATWASETRGSEAAYFVFLSGRQFWYPQSYDSILRALPVRSGK